MVVLVLLTLPFVFYMSNSKATRDHNFFDRGVVFISAPIQSAVAWTLDGISSVWHSYIGLVGVQLENDRLKEENKRLQAELVAREEQRIENERLRLLVGLRERAPDVRMLHARVIATAPTPLFRSIRLNIGEQDGVHLGSAVINSDGVIGRVTALTAGYADVMLLVDANNSTDVLVQRTRARARVRGTGSDVHLGIQVEYLSRTADVEPGDVLITSGTGEIFPKGLPVGTIMSVERGAFGLYQQATVEPSVDFARIESVMVIVEGGTADTSFEKREEPGTNTQVMQEGESVPGIRVPENVGNAIVEETPPGTASVTPEGTVP